MEELLVWFLCHADFVVQGVVEEVVEFGELAAQEMDLGDLVTSSVEIWVGREAWRAENSLVRRQVKVGESFL